jgi:hypothetical protein
MSTYANILLVECRKVYLVPVFQIFEYLFFNFFGIACWKVTLNVISTYIPISVYIFFYGSCMDIYLFKNKVALISIYTLELFFPKNSTIISWI